MKRILFIIAMLTVWHSVARAQTDAPGGDPLAEKAAALFEHEIGVWKSRWVNINPQGDPAGETTGTEEFSWYLGDAVVELSTFVPSRNQHSKALRFYSPREKTILFWSVDERGDHWVMRQDPETGTVVSDPHPTQDGGEMRLRFKTLRMTDNEMDVSMEISRDGGETWTLARMQYLKRAEHAPQSE